MSASFDKPSLAAPDLAALFGGAKLFGTLSLGDVLGALPALDAATFARATLSDPDLDALLADPARRLEVPVVRERPITLDGGRPAREVRFVWKPVLQPSGRADYPLVVGPDTTVVLDSRQAIPLDGSTGTTTISGDLRRFDLAFAGVIDVSIERLTFTSLDGRKPDIHAEGFGVAFEGPLAFVNTLSDVLPSDGFADPPAIAVTTEGISAGYSLGIPTVGVGVFSLQNLALSAALSIPFTERPAGLRFGISERHHPFLVTVTLFGGGGFFGLGVSASGVEEIEAAIEFGGNISINIGVASGGVYVMAGVYFGRTGTVATLTGYLRCGGYLEVLGLIAISVEFYLAFTYRDKGGGHSEVWGQATVTVCVSVCCFSKSVELTVERRFAGGGGDPTFADVMSLDDWTEYCDAFAA